MKEPLIVCMGSPTWLRMEPKTKQSPLRWIKNTTLVFAVIPSDHEVSKDPPFMCIFSTFPSVQNPETGSKSNNSKHSSQGQSNTNTRGDFKFHSPEKWLSEASQMQHLQLWVTECSKCEPQSQSFWQQQISHKFWDRTYKNSITQIPFPNYSDYMLK